MDIPLVSAIMPTRGRRGWAADAVRMFKEQAYPNKELVIVDDIMEPSFINRVPDPGIVYMRSPRIPVGAKRNLAVSRASGVIVMHWDSDDVYRRDRMEFQVEMLLNSGADLVGFNELDFEDADTGAQYLYVAGDKHYAAGVSFCYWKEIWEQRKFEAVDTGEDTEFWRNRNVLCCAGEGRIVARIHNGNTAEKRSEIAKWPHAWIRKERVAA